MSTEVDNEEGALERELWTSQMIEKRKTFRGRKARLTVKKFPKKGIALHLRGSGKGVSLRCARV